jgi:hypothetical protein
MKRFHGMASKGVAGFLIAAATTVGASSAEPTSNLFLGRWTVLNDRQTLTEPQQPYKTVDIVPCGASLCGISVGDAGACGDVLFRRLTLHEGPLGVFLDGSGKWGKDSLSLRIIRLEDAPQIRLFLTKFTPVGNDEETGTLELKETYGHAADATCKAP